MFDEAADVLIAKRMNRQSAATVLSRKWGISRRRAQDYVTGVVNRLVRNDGVPIEQKKAIARETLMHIMRVALSHKRALVVGDGGGEAHVELWEEPNEVAALKAAELQMKLDGLLAEQKLDITVGGSVEVQVMAAMQRAYGLTVGTVVEEPKTLPEETEP